MKSIGAEGIHFDDSKRAADFSVLFDESSEFETMLSLPIWSLLNSTLGEIMARVVESRSHKLIMEKLTKDELVQWNNGGKEKILAIFRRNFGDARAPEIYSVNPAVFMLNTTVISHFRRHVANAPALDDVYNVLGSFQLGGKKVWPFSGKPDIFSKLHLSVPKGQGVRNRYRQVMRAYKETGGGKTLSIACGSAQPLIQAASELIREGKGKDIHVTLTDMDDFSLELARKRTEQSGISDRVCLKKASFSELVNLLKKEKFDVIEVCGLYDYFLDKQVMKMVKMVLEGLKPDGTLIASAMSETPFANLLRRIYNWEIVYRTPYAFGQLIEDAGGKKVNVYVEPWKIYMVATATT